MMIFGMKISHCGTASIPLCEFPVLEIQPTNRIMGIILGLNGDHKLKTVTKNRRILCRGRLSALRSFMGTLRQYLATDSLGRGSTDDGVGGSKNGKVLEMQRLK